MKKLIAVFVGLLVLFSGPAAEAAVNPSAFIAVQGMLYERTAAVVAKDRSAFEATIDPEAGREFHDDEMRRFDGLISLPITDLLYQVDEKARGDLSPGLDIDSEYEGAQETYLPRTTRSYRLADFDSVPQIDSWWYTYVKRDGRWYVGSDDDVADLGLRNDQSLWDFGSVSTTATPHFLVVSTPSKADRAQTVGDLAEQALSRVDANWSLPWSQRVPIIIPGNASQAAELLQTDVDVNNFVAFASYTPVRTGTSYSITAPRIFTQEDQLARQSPERQIDNLAHELTHVAAASSAGPFTPIWLQEGTAEFVRLNSPTDYAKVAGATELPNNPAFSSGDSINDAYRNSASAVAYVARTYGPRSPETLFQSIGKARVVPGTPSYNVNAATIEALGVDIKTVQDRWLAAP